MESFLASPNHAGKHGASTTHAVDWLDFWRVDQLPKTREMLRMTFAYTIMLTENRLREDEWIM